MEFRDVILNTKRRIIKNPLKLVGKKYQIDFQDLEEKAKLEKIVVCTSEANTFNLCGIADSMVIVPNESIKNSMSNTFKKYNLGRTNALTRIALEAAYNDGKYWLN
jgi:bifunctional pyridoxal-dependent enzyme with beta-cystathionase and maltose regulon repressor activities